MRIGGYTLEQGPAPGWNPPLRLHRVSQVATIGGARVTVLPGHISDEPLEIPFQGLDASPGKTLIHSYQGITDGYSFGNGEALGVPLPSWGTPPPEFSAGSACSLWLRAAVPLVGFLTVEIWRTDPMERIGLLGVIEPADLTSSYQKIYRWNLAAWPIQDVVCMLVLNGEHMTGGAIYWGGETATQNGHLRYVGGEWTTVWGQLAHELWQGGQENILRGLAADQGEIPPLYEIDFGNGPIYTGRIVRIESDMRLLPQAYNDVGLARETRATILLESEL